MKNFLNAALPAGAQATTASLFAVGTIVVSHGQADVPFRPLDRNWSDWMDPRQDTLSTMTGQSS
jgi:hypothetical protein